MNGRIGDREHRAVLACYARGHARGSEVDAEPPAVSRGDEMVRKTAHRDRPDRSIVIAQIGIVIAQIGIVIAQIGHRDHGRAPA